MRGSKIVLVIGALALSIFVRVTYATELTGYMGTARSGHVAARLPDGRVLVAGGWTGTATTASAEIYDPAKGTFSPTGSLANARSSHAAATLPDGRILVLGGQGPVNGFTAYLASAEIYDPATGLWSAAGSMSVPRQSSLTALVLVDGKVLVIGSSVGTSASPWTTVCEIFDPATQSFRSTGSPITSRQWMGAAVLQDSRVLVTGGSTPSGAYLSSAEIWDPVSGTWSATGPMSSARSSGSATTLTNGKVLVAGGHSGSSYSTAVPAAELYDPATGTFSTTGTLVVPRSRHVPMRLADGNVVVIGGVESSGMSGRSIERYDVATGTWSLASRLLRENLGHTASLLLNQNVLITGGSNGNMGVLRTAEIFDPILDPQCLSVAASLSPASQSISGFGGTGRVSVTQPLGCPWIVSNPPTWMTVTSGAQGRGDGTVEYTISSNPQSGRGATVVIAEKNFIVNQAANPCWSSPAISPLSQSFGESGGSGSVSVTHPAACGAWTVSNIPTWITVTSGTSGVGNGIFTYSVAANTGSARTATLRFGTTNFTVTQAASVCFTSPPSLSPSSQSIGAGGGTGSVSVTHLAGCAWTVTNIPSWITITSGSPGSGSGNFAYLVAANAGSARSATLNIGNAGFTVSQAANACLAVPASISPTSMSFGTSGGTGSILVNHQAGCAWSTSGVPSWLTITAGASGTGSGTVAYSVAANTGVARSATLKVAGASFAASQAGTVAYCASRGNASGYEWIQQVSIAGQSRNTGNNGGYADLTTSTAPIGLARAYNSISLSPGFSSGAYSETWRIWIDLNSDGVFNDNEIVFTGTNSGPIGAGFGIPSWAPYGTSRMRISMKYGGTPSPCENFSYGEVEDYTVTY